MTVKILVLQLKQVNPTPHSADLVLSSSSVSRWWRWIRPQMVWEPQLSSTSLSWTTTTTPHSSHLSRTPYRSPRATTPRKIQATLSPSSPLTPTSAPTERSPSPSPPLTHSSGSERWGEERIVQISLTCTALVLRLWVMWCVAGWDIACCWSSGSGEQGNSWAVGEGLRQRHPTERGESKALSRHSAAKSY